MKKLLGILIIMLLLICFTVTCFAFPAPGMYSDGDGGTLTIEINKSENKYYGNMRIPTKGGAFIADWYMPLSKGNNSDGFYEIDLAVDTANGRVKTDRLIGQLSENSFKMYSVDLRTGKKYSWGIWNKLN